MIISIGMLSMRDNDLPLLPFPPYRPPYSCLNYLVMVEVVDVLWVDLSPGAIV